MKNLEEWFFEYGKSHQNEVNIKIHKVCVPVIMLSILGLISLIETPSLFVDLKINYAHLISVLALIFYATLSFPLSALMMVLLVFMLETINYAKIHFTFNDTLILWVALFLLGWVGQFIGHKIEGKKPSFLQDIVFLLIGPLWVIAPVLPKYRKK